MTKSKIFFILSLAFISGVFCASFYYPKIADETYLCSVLLIAIVILVVFYKKPMMIAGFVVLFFVLGLWLVERRLEAVNGVKESDFSGTAMIVKEPEIKGRQQKLIVEPTRRDAAVPGGDAATPGGDAAVLRLYGSEGRILINTGVYPEYKYGDVLQADCQLEIPKNIENEEGGSFDYRMYLAKDGVFWECKKPKLEATGENRGNRFFTAILALKNKFNKNINSLMPSPQSGLLSGLLIGGSGLLSKDYQNYFSATGTTHIVAVSGYNVTIVAEYLMLLGIFLGLWRQQAFWFAALGIILFVILTGMPSSAVRAGVMGILLIWAMKNGRLANAQNAILFAAMVMLIINPLALRWDVGFQLSFLATLGIVYVYPIFNNYIVKKFPQQSISVITETLFLTLSAQVFVVPILIINFQKLSLISLLANILVLPIIPLTMLVGFITILLSFFVPPVGQVMAWIAFLPLKYETVVIKYLAGLKYAAVEVKIFQWWMVALWYIILGWGICILRKKISTNSINE